MDKEISKTGGKRTFFSGREKRKGHVNSIIARFAARRGRLGRPYGGKKAFGANEVSPQGAAHDSCHSGTRKEKCQHKAKNWNFLSLTWDGSPDENLQQKAGPSTARLSHRTL